MPTRLLSIRGIAALSGCALLLAGCSAAASRPGAASSSPVSTSSSASPMAGPVPAPAAPAQAACGDGPALLNALSTRDKLAQVLMVGVKSSADARAVVDTYHVGGIFIGSWTDLSMLTDGSLPDIANAGPLPLAVSVDEEGGRVERLSKLIGPAPSARVLAATQTPEQVYQLALDRGRQMRGMGITIDFAPVVDVTDAADDTVIGDRSFSNDPAVVTAYAGAYARGLRDAGLLPVLKHFPGHGHGSGDSHTAGAVTTPPLADLQANDLIPYRTLTTEAPVAVMVGHLEVPGLTGTQPASLSAAAVGLLRSGGYGGPGFDGPVFSDDLSSMAAISDRYGVAEAVLRSLQAGIDVALWVTTDEVPAVLDRLEKAVNAGELSLPAVETSLLRMARLKGQSPRCGG
ncbi:glycoside hydrolase family 3 N-terminal domain-containing protein [Mycobacterium sp. RTGN5]|uniref:glycoside hydrolase family 3 N-terminal domain-containing protein n=1 Tax=Mycobacterium sp. RTGN5 TaxID=3016522 RepID=UPI0029C83ACC|nr:glycoside hydrolase family 3 N-terminal domain-containing protein [Mycobacterium sp. RTGN5]